MGRILFAIAVVLGVSALAYGVYFVATWMGYGKASHNAYAPNRELLDQFLPDYEVSEEHDVSVDAPASLTFEVSKDADPQRSPLVRAIFEARRRLMGGGAAPQLPHKSLVQMTEDLGWGVLAEEPGRVLVMGAVTRPWHADVSFRSLPPDQFASFHEPGYTKIIWTVEVDSIGPSQSIARTQTRVATTDPESRKRFRAYWSKFSPGILLIRKEILSQIKVDAERRARETRHAGRMHQSDIDAAAIAASAPAAALTTSPVLDPRPAPRYHPMLSIREPLDIVGSFKYSHRLVRWIRSPTL